MASTSYSCVRYIFCWVNVLFWISGCGILGAGIWLRIAYEGYTNLLPQYALLSADTLAIVLGAIIFVLAFFGCCGSWFQNRCLLITYFILVIFIFIAEFLMGSLAFVFRESLSHTLKEELIDGITNHYNVTANGPNSLVTIWDHLQSKYHCCGVKNYEDWYSIQAWPDEKWVPDSCCIGGEACGKLRDPAFWFTIGCFDQIHMLFVQRLHIIGIVGFIVAFIQFSGLISSMLLFCTVKNKRISHTYKSYDCS